MIRLYSNINLVNKNLYIPNVNKFFDKHIKCNDFDKTDIKVIKVLDKAKITDVNLGTIKTKYGLTNIKNLSTGCKTVLVYRYLEKNIRKYNGYFLNITECGDNAVNLLFKCVKDNTEIKFVTFGYPFVEVKDKTFLINDKETSNKLGLELSIDECWEVE